MPAPRIQSWTIRTQLLGPLGTYRLTMNRNIKLVLSNTGHKIREHKPVWESEKASLREQDVS